MKKKRKPSIQPCVLFPRGDTIEAQYMQWGFVTHNRGSVRVSHEGSTEVWDGTSTDDTEMMTTNKK